MCCDNRYVITSMVVVGVRLLTAPSILVTLAKCTAAASASSLAWQLPPVIITIMLRERIRNNSYASRGQRIQLGLAAPTRYITSTLREMICYD